MNNLFNHAMQEGPRNQKEKEMKHLENVDIDIASQEKHIVALQ